MTTQVTQTTTKKGLSILNAAYELGYGYGQEYGKAEKERFYSFEYTLDDAEFAGEHTSYNTFPAVWELNKIAGEEIKASRTAFILGFKDGAQAAL